jgi:hypothetical protein
MAEVATTVLHNVGNVLNSVNVPLRHREGPAKGATFTLELPVGKS